MRFAQQPRLDWEPLRLRLDFKSHAAPNRVTFQEQCAKYLTKRDAESDCACRLTLFHVTVAEKNRIELLCEWLCPRCLPPFINFLEQSFLGLRSVEAGYEEDVAVPRSGSGFIEVEAQTVELEDGNSLYVDPFRIAQVPTRTREFMEFVEATGYRTSAERNGDAESFLKNAVTEGCSKRELAETPVNCVSYHDAIAYCSWRGVQLPTEAQWLVAAITEPKVYAREEYRSQRFWERGGRYLPELSNEEWTKTIDKPGFVVVRRGPRWARTTTWREEVREHRFVVPLDSYDIMTTFRVVRV